MVELHLGTNFKDKKEWSVCNFRTELLQIRKIINISIERLYQIANRKYLKIKKVMKTLKKLKFSDHPATGKIY